MPSRSWCTRKGQGTMRDRSIAIIGGRRGRPRRRLLRPDERVPDPDLRDARAARRGLHLLAARRLRLRRLPPVADGLASRARRSTASGRSSAPSPAARSSTTTNSCGSRGATAGRWSSTPTPIAWSATCASWRRRTRRSAMPCARSIRRCAELDRVDGSVHGLAGVASWLAAGVGLLPAVPTLAGLAGPHLAGARGSLHRPLRARRHPVDLRPAGFSRAARPHAARLDARP